MSREIIRNYRLSPTELNALLRRLAALLQPDLSPIEYQSVSTLSLHGKKFAILPMCKDAETDTNESNLKFIGDILKAYCREHLGEDCTLLIPMRMCRGYFKAPTYITSLKRKHAVLVEINLKDMHTEIHDSQGRFRRIFYPDKLAEIAKGIGLNYEPSKDYHAHGMQENLFLSDVVSCGYYVFAYISHILKTGSSAGCEKIILDVMKEYRDKCQFLREHGVEISGLENFDDDEDDDLLEFEITDSVDKKLFTFEIDTENEIKIDDDKSIIKKPEEKDKIESALATQGLFGSDKLNAEAKKSDVEVSEHGLKF